MEKLLINDRSLSQSKQTKNSKEKPYYHLQYQTQHHVTRQPSNNNRRQASCGAIHQKYALSSNVQLEMVQVALATGGGSVFLNHYPPRQFSLNSSLPPILPTHLQPHYYQQQNKMNHQQHHHQQQQQQHPPLLPLPSMSKPAFRSLPPSTLPKKKPNKTKLTTTTSTTTTRKPGQNIKKENKVVVMVDETGKDTKREEDVQVVVVGSAKEKEPDPVSPPKGSMTWVLREADLNNNINRTSSEITEVPSLFFNFKSPPPSSLPLPKFTMRQNKLSCNAEAAATDGVDSGATDNLRRMLKLR